MSRHWRNRLRKQKKKKETKITSLLDGFKRLVELRVAVVKDNKYVYSPEFEISVKQVIESPPRRLKQLSVGRKVGRKLAPYLLPTATSYTSKRDIENMIIAFLCLERHSKRLRLSLSESTLLELTHSTWYLNDNEPLAEEES